MKYHLPLFLAFAFFATQAATAQQKAKSIADFYGTGVQEIRIELLYVQAVDGQMIPLNGNEQTIRGQFPGQDAAIENGTSITANVTNNIEIKVD